jgi:hypothetical protein
MRHFVPSRCCNVALTDPPAVFPMTVSLSTRMAQITFVGREDAGRIGVGENKEPSQVSGVVFVSRGSDCNRSVRYQENGIPVSKSAMDCV